MAAGMTVAGISGREPGSGSKRSFPRRISARCRFEAVWGVGFDRRPLFSGIRAWCSSCHLPLLRLAVESNLCRIRLETQIGKFCRPCRYQPFRSSPQRAWPYPLRACRRWARPSSTRSDRLHHRERHWVDLKAADFVILQERVHPLRQGRSLRSKLEPKPLRLRVSCAFKPRTSML